MMKQALQYLLSRVGLKLVRVRPFVDPIAPIDALELAVRAELFRAGESFYFVKIGASDGALVGSLNLLIRRYGLRGCLIAPDQPSLSRLASQLSDQSQLDFRRVVIGKPHAEGLVPLIRPVVARGPGFFDALPGVDRVHVQASAEAAPEAALRHGLGNEVQTFVALMATLPADRISLLHVDTDGSDDLIIEAAFEASIFPNIINYGWTEMSAERRFLLKMRLLDNGYRFIDIGADTVCMRGELE